MLALNRAWQIFHIVTSTGYTGPTPPPSPQEFYFLAALGAFLTGLFVLVGSSVLLHDHRKA